MRLAADAHNLVETFLREHLQDDSLKLPTIILFSGAASRFITRAFGTDAITISRFIIISPDVLHADMRGRLSAPGDLVVHEATHVCQYSRAGLAGFLFSYLRGFLRELRAQGKMDKAARMAAYLAIREECDARAAGHAYALWSAKQRLLEDET